jgi:golgi-specific brefeldin A-resistance guanine nucleotide exchange factor 1
VSNHLSTDIVPIPYGLPAIRELLRVLISLLNPHEHKHTDSMRLMALSILNVAFDVGGRSISRFESLRNLITDDFCKYLFQLAKTDSIPLLTLTLRVISSVFDTMRPYLKLQQELFLFFLIERLTRTGSTNTGITYNIDEEGSINFVLPNPDSTKDGRDSGYVDVRSASPSLGGRSSDSRSMKLSSESGAYSGEVRELLLECLTQCARIPTFMVDLWVNFDSDISCGNLFEELIHFLSKVKHKIGA